MPDHALGLCVSNGPHDSGWSKFFLNLFCECKSMHPDKDVSMRGYPSWEKSLGTACRNTRIRAAPSRARRPPSPQTKRASQGIEAGGLSPMIKLGDRRPYIRPPFPSGLAWLQCLMHRAHVRL